ncbi:MAG: LysR family transcriptional regulator [Butyricicoccus sp.]
MTIEHLRYFLAAAKYLNMSKAASALYIHQSTLSRCIAGLEEELGVQLFIRMKYSLPLTTAGILLRNEAEPVVERYQYMLTRIRESDVGTAGHLTLQSPQTYFQMLADAYCSFAQRNPRAELAIDVCPFSRMDFVCDSVLDGAADMGITFSQNLPADVSNLELYRLYTEHLLLTVPLTHPLAGQGHVRLSELRNERLLVADHLGKSFLSALYSVVEPATLHFIHSSSGETMLLQFTAGMGLTFMPALIGGGKGENFAALEIDDVNSAFDVLLVWRKNSSNPLLPLFVDAVKAHPALLHPVGAPEMQKREGIQ